MFDPTARRRVGVLAIGLALTAPVTGTARGATASRR